MKNRFYYRVTSFTVLSMLFVVTNLSSAYADNSIPVGLTDEDPLVRIVALQEVGRNNIKSAEGQIAKMAKEDSFAGVREAACIALHDINAVWQVDLLSDIAANDVEPSVRKAAAAAVSAFQRDLMRDTKLQSAPYDHNKLDKQKVEPSKPTEETRHFGIGIGVMGGYGVIALNLRGRIPTGIRYLPWVGIEAGGGWTPRQLYTVTAGPVDRIDAEEKNKLFSGAGALLLYPHRQHYAVVRGGYDIGRGGYALFGYGLEMLNPNGFVSWGVEAGILYQPIIDEKIKRVNTCDETNSCTSETWPVAPYVRFSVHFYPI